MVPIEAEVDGFCGGWFDGERNAGWGGDGVAAGGKVDGETGAAAKFGGGGSVDGDG